MRSILIVAWIILIAALAGARTRGSQKDSVHNKKFNHLKWRLKRHSIRITWNDISVILSLHNELRSSVASGHPKDSKGQSYNFPLAQNMKTISWDPEIASKAQQWANNKLFQHSSSSYRKTSKFWYIGENLYLLRSTQQGQVPWRAAIWAWFDEISKFDTGTIDSYNGSPGTGHFTQIIWGATYAIGCGANQWYDGQLYRTFIVCEYGPGGNILSNPIYT